MRTALRALAPGHASQKPPPDDPQGGSLQPPRRAPFPGKPLTHACAMHNQSIRRIDRSP